MSVVGCRTKRFIARAVHLCSLFYFSHSPYFFSKVQFCAFFWSQIPHLFSIYFFPFSFCVLLIHDFLKLITKTRCADLEFVISGCVVFLSLAANFLFMSFFFSFKYVICAVAKPNDVSFLLLFISHSLSHCFCSWCTIFVSTSAISVKFFCFVVVLPFELSVWVKITRTWKINYRQKQSWHCEVRHAVWHWLLNEKWMNSSILGCFCKHVYVCVCVDVQSTFGFAHLKRKNIENSSGRRWNDK